jgi:hypothetical protein
VKNYISTQKKDPSFLEPNLQEHSEEDSLFIRKEKLLKKFKKEL